MYIFAIGDFVTVVYFYFLSYTYVGTRVEPVNVGPFVSCTTYIMLGANRDGYTPLLG